MEGTKSWYQSLGMWGGIITLLAVVGTIFGFSISAEDQVTATTLAVTIATTIGGIFNLVGRIRASKKID